MKKSWLLITLALGCAQSTEIDASKDAAQNAGGKGDNGVDLCEFYGWYGDGVCDEWCPLPDKIDCTDDELEASCAAQDAQGDDLCRALVGYVWNGSSCEATWGCACLGAGCDEIFGDETSCEAAFASCRSDEKCCDPADYPEGAIEGAHCCADGSWTYDNGNGSYDGECQYNGGEGMKCEPEPTCCDPDDHPEFAPEGAHCCADGSWAYDNGNGSYDNECEYNGGEGNVCEAECPDLDFSIACVNPALYECRAGTLPYDGALEGCECGCIKSDACLDPDAPGVEYIGNLDQCAVIRFVCDDGKEPFFNDCGCGCVAS